MLHMNVSIRTRLNFSEEMSAYLFKKEKSEEERKRKEVKERQNKTNKQTKKTIMLKIALEKFHYCNNCLGRFGHYGRVFHTASGKCSRIQVETTHKK